MKLRPTLRAATASVGVLAAVSVFALVVGCTLVGVPLNPGPLLAGLLVVAVLAAVTVYLGFRKGASGLARFVAAAETLWVVAAVGAWQLLGTEGELVSASKSPALVDAILWPLVAISTAAFIGMSMAAARLLAHPGIRVRP
ncbi:hypothetical protein ACQCSX_20610 [Pseudarthrobacter sp. P1]|uniref:hypothetical protein n=1 Tax=Pseudarthrobacter sp. P1 TaxID=3418418 RepID=UPI003CF831C1